MQRPHHHWQADFQLGQHLPMGQILPEPGPHPQLGQGLAVGLLGRGVAMAVHHLEVIQVGLDARGPQVDQRHGDRAGLALAPALRAVVGLIAEREIPQFDHPGLGRRFRCRNGRAI